MLKNVCFDEHAWQKSLAAIVTISSTKLVTLGICDAIPISNIILYMPSKNKIDRIKFLKGYF